MGDWRLARRIAAGVGGDAPMPELPGDLAALCADAQRRVVDYAQLTPAVALPGPELIDRAAGSEATLRGMAVVREPLTQKIGPAGGPFREPVRAAAGLIIAAEV